MPEKTFNKRIGTKIPFLFSFFFHFGSTSFIGFLQEETCKQNTAYDCKPDDSLIPSHVTLTTDQSIPFSFFLMLGLIVSG